MQSLSASQFIIDFNLLLKYQRISLTLPGGACISHSQRALFGYLFSSYPGDLMVPADAVNSTGLSSPHALASLPVPRVPTTIEEVINVEQRWK